MFSSRQHFYQVQFQILRTLALAPIGDHHCHLVSILGLTTQRSPANHVGNERPKYAELDISVLLLQNLTDSIR
uniref:WGS project CBMG000000000 data, contig CS5907-c003833 n=1 Tax=Fusarium acuminatum CS5907 TaxID=1318461 RepID=A0A090MA60_9HYPO|nr:unnamed protein product [Fusarium acuminatum CS5907]